MNFEDFILPPPKINFEMGQLGSLFVEDLPENGVAFLVVSDYRGNDFDGSSTDATGFREQFYTLSASDFTMPIYDFGDLISGKTHQDTHYILQEVLSACHYKNTIPVIIGGSLDFAHLPFPSIMMATCFGKFSRFIFSFINGILFTIARWSSKGIGKSYSYTI
jgi:hypothetical protein